MGRSGWALETTLHQETCLQQSLVIDSVSAMVAAKTFKLLQWLSRRQTANA